MLAASKGVSGGTRKEWFRIIIIMEVLRGAWVTAGLITAITITAGTMGITDGIRHIEDGDGKFLMIKK